MQNDPQNQERSQPIASRRYTAFLEKPVFWIFFIFLVFALPLYRSMVQPKPEIPPVLGEINEFQLINQNGKPVLASDLRGSVVVANFIFTSCEMVCPLLSAQMAKIQSRLMGIGPAIRLISISVDPDTDTPEVLKEYADSFKADHKIWQFLTGPIDEIEKAIVGGFKVGFSRKEAEETSTLMDITHGEHFVVLDQLGQIRAYMPAKTNDEINKIVSVIGLLANLKPQKQEAVKEINALSR